MRHHVGLAPAERAHVVQEIALLAAPEVAPIQTVARGALQDRLVDVGDVLRVANADPARLEQPRQDIEDQEGARVSEVRRVVRRDAADIDGDGGGSCSERQGALATRVVEGEHLA
jgi:hypothetical protein